MYVKQECQAVHHLLSAQTNKISDGCKPSPPAVSRRWIFLLAAGLLPILYLDDVPFRIGNILNS